MRNLACQLWGRFWRCHGARKYAQFTEEIEILCMLHTRRTFEEPVQTAGLTLHNLLSM